jgi:WD40 repeat protein
MVLTGSDDRNARLWEAATGRPLGAPYPHPAALHAVAFSPDGRTLLTGCEDGLARFWEVPAPLEGEAERIAVWVRVLTGMELDDNDAVRVLDAAAWRRWRQRLEQLGGAPEP